jgi:hypothetical protein
MNEISFNWDGREQKITGRIDPVNCGLNLSICYRNGSILEATLQDGCANPVRQGRTNLFTNPAQWLFFTNLYGKPGACSFFTDRTTISQSSSDGRQTALLTTLLNPGAEDPLFCHYRLDWLESHQAIHVQTWFEGTASFPVHQLKWLDLNITRTDLVQYDAGLPAWSGTVGAMTEPLSFRDFVCLHKEQAALTLCNTGRIILAPDQDNIRLAAFADLLGLTDDISLFSADTPLSAWISLAPWQGTKAAIKRQDELAKSGNLPGPGASAATYASAAPAAASADDYIRLTAGSLEIDLLHQPAGVSLAAVGGALAVYRDGPAQPLFTLQALDLRDGQVSQLSSGAGWQSVTVDQLDDYCVFDFCNPLIDRHPVDDFSIQVAATSRPEQNRIEWQVHVLNNHPGISVISCDFPILPFREGNWDMVLPKASGVLHRDAVRHGSHLAAIYPAYTLAMPWYAVYRPEMNGLNGLYCGAHDPDGCRKDLAGTTLPGSEYGRIRFSCPAVGLGTGANSWSLPGQMVWQLFSGDWYDAAVIYRDFVHARANWLPDETLQGRPDSPDWFRDLPFWIMDWLPNGNPDKEPIPVSIRPETPPGPRDWIDLPVKLQQALGVPIGYHVYNWHWIPFNNDFPHYFPIEAGFAEGVRELQGNDVQVMPYINGRLWDTLDKRDEDFRFTREALPHAAKHLDGSVMTESYASHEPDGRLCRLAVMCPSSWFWVRELKSITDRLFREVGVKAVYIDQVAAASQNLCCDQSHNHLPGGGSWWNESYQALMRELNRNKPADRAFTTECNAEPHAASFDGYLTWQWIEPEQIPAFPLIYAGRVAMLGRNINGYKKNDVAYCKFHIAEQVLFGQQIGWINADIVDYPAKFPFLKKMVQLRWQYRKLFNSGRLLRPPVVEADLPDQASFAGMGRPPAWQVFAMPPVRAGLWQDESGTCTLFAVNTADHEAACTVTVNLADRLLPAAEADVRLVYCESAGEKAQPVLENQLDGLKIQVSLAPEGMLVLEWPLK